MSLSQSSGDTLTTTRALPFEFRGDGSEYFKIWIVNVLLTIVTLGIYSAWAKVRNNRYFYSNVYLDSRSFRYLADPLVILKGRLIAVAFFAIYALCLELYPVAGLLVTLLLVVATPFLIVRSIAFSNRMSAYRNIQFRFNGTFGEAAVAFLGWPALSILSLGLLAPLALLKANEFVVKHSAYGATSFDFEATAWDYAKIYLGFFGILFVTAGLSAAISGSVSATAGAAVIPVGYAIALAAFTVGATNIYYNSSALEGHRFKANLEIPGFLSLHLVNVVLIILTLGLYLPFAKVRVAKYRAEHIQFLALGSLDDFAAAEQERVNAIGEELSEVFDFDIGAV